MAVHFQQRRDTAANFTSSNPIMVSGEMGFETDTGRLKLGDGTTAWVSLAYFNISFIAGTSLGAAPSYPQWKLITTVPNELYLSVQKTGGAWDWVNIISAP